MHIFVLRVLNGQGLGFRAALGFRVCGCLERTLGFLVFQV